MNQTEILRCRQPLAEKRGRREGMRGAACATMELIVRKEHCSLPRCARMVVLGQGMHQLNLQEHHLFRGPAGNLLRESDGETAVQAILGVQGGQQLHFDAVVDSVHHSGL
jgi:hypothetical protein